MQCWTILLTEPGTIWAAKYCSSLFSSTLLQTGRFFAVYSSVFSSKSKIFTSCNTTPTFEAARVGTRKKTSCFNLIRWMIHNTWKVFFTILISFWISSSREKRNLCFGTTRRSEQETGLKAVTNRVQLLSKLRTWYGQSAKFFDDRNGFY